jgi:hypothetical protein
VDRLADGLTNLGAGSLGDLVARIRSGAFDDRSAELYPFLRETVRHRLAVANPRHLQEES